MAAIAFVQRSNADRQADERRSGELAGLATLAIDEDPERAILLGLAAMERTRPAVRRGDLGAASRNAVDAADLQ